MKGRPKDTKKQITKVNIDIEKFKKRVSNGQSINMLSWEFKIPKPVVVRLCKEHNIPYNDWDMLRYVNKL